MRLVFLTLALAGLAGAAAAQEAPNARAAYVERRGLLEADTQCRLFRSDIRAALEVGALQARGSLLRAGWSNTQVRTLELAATSAARTRACSDSRTITAADTARRSFATWANAGTMEFPGWERAWIARRAALGNPAWRLSQAIDAPMSAVFGVRQRETRQALTLVVPVARGQSAPVSASLVLRDHQRAPMHEISLPQRISYGLAAGAPAPNNALTVPSTRTIERIEGGRSQAVFTFPDTAFRDFVALDPRESVELRVNDGRTTRRLYVEVGDIAAARSFLTIR